MKKLYKSNHNIMIDGVCGGIAEYLNMDPTLVRIIWLVLFSLAGSGIIAYIVCMIVLPRDPYCHYIHDGGNADNHSAPRNE